jgi:hypothetical protein
VGSSSLGYGLIVVPIAYAISGLLFLAASRGFLRDIAPEPGHSDSSPAAIMLRG